MLDINDIFTGIDPDINHFDLNPINFEPHSINSFINRKTQMTKSLKIINHNARSLMKEGRIDEYQLYLNSLQCQFDILLFTETWLKQENKDHCKFDGYQPIHLIRPIDDHIDFKERGGGISIFVKDNLSFKHRSDLTTMLPFMECSFIEISYNNQNYLIGGIYRIPKTCINSFIEQFNRLIEPIKYSHKIILLGDYNIDFLKNDNHKNNFVICLQSNYLVPTILKPTRVATKIKNGQEITTKTLIDNIFINHNMNHSAGIIESSITDHYTIYIMIPEIETSYPKQKTRQYRLINPFTHRKFNTSLIQSNIQQALNNQDADSATLQFFDTFESSYNKSFPIKTKIVSKKDEQKPWVNDSLIEKIKIRDKLAKLSSKNKISRKQYTDYRNSLTTELRQAKATYYENQLETHSNNIKKTWEVINSLIKPKKAFSKTNLKNDNDKPYEETEVPNKIIDYFTTIADQLAAGIPPSLNDATSYMEKMMNNKNKYHPSFMLPP